MAVQMTVFNIGAVIGSLFLIWFVAYGILTDTFWEEDEDGEDLHDQAE